MQNYFEYFSEIEAAFSRRRGSILLLSTLDWALIETWREAGVPLAAVLRGIEAAFDKYDARASRAKGRTRKVNGLAWCAQAVMQAAEEMVEAATGAPVAASKHAAAESGFEAGRVAAYLERNAGSVAASPASRLAGASETVSATSQRLRELATAMRTEAPALDELDRTLTVMEERLVAALRGAIPEAEAVALREQAERELAPYRAKMPAAQLKQVTAQFEQKRLLEAYLLPRLSLFYMGHE
jgi:hypothetical protein